MKNIIIDLQSKVRYLFFLLIIVTLASCAGEEEDVFNNISEPESAILSTNSASVEISGPDTVDCTSSASVTLSATNFVNLPGPKRFSWSIVSGNGNIITQSNLPTIIVIFSSDFEPGQSIVVELEVRSRNGLSATTQHIITCPGGGPVKVNPPGQPGPIIFDSFEQGRFCTRTRANLLEAGEAECAEYYIWSVSPSGPGITLTPKDRRTLISVSDPGTYVVTVVAVNSAGESEPRSITLTAENCSDGSGLGFL